MHLDEHDQMKVSLLKPSTKVQTCHNALLKPSTKVQKCHTCIDKGKAFTTRCVQLVMVLVPQKRGVGNCRDLKLFSSFAFFQPLVP